MKIRVDFFNAILTRFFIYHYFLIFICVVFYHLLGQKPTAASYILDSYIVLCLLYAMYITRKGGIGAVVEPAFIFFIFIIWQGVLFYTSLDGADTYIYMRAIRFSFYLFCFVAIGRMLYFMGERGADSLAPSVFVFTLNFSFLFVYFLYGVVLGVGRPVLYSENNYEVPSLILLNLFFLSTTKLKNSSSLFVLIVAFLSRSKSGILEVILYFFSIYFKPNNLKNYFLILIALFIISPVAIFVILERVGDGGVDSVDRLIFLNAFLEVSFSSSIYQGLLGHGVGSILPYDVCYDLRFWASRVSEDYAYCDATVFHSFFMKLVYEVGVLGAVVFLWMWAYYLIKFFGMKLGFVAFCVVLVCSLSVTGFSNSIVIWPLFLSLFYKLLNNTH